MSDLKKKVASIFKQDNTQNLGGDPDKLLYSGGFFNDSDKRLVEKISREKPENLDSYYSKLYDKRLPEMLFRYKAKNFPGSLSEADNEKWNTYRLNRIEELTPSAGYMEKLNKKITVENLTGGSTKNVRTLFDLKNYAESIVPSLQSFNQEEFLEMVGKGEKAWAGVDVMAFLESLRDNIPATIDEAERLGFKVDLKPANLFNESREAIEVSVFLPHDDYSFDSKFALVDTFVAGSRVDSRQMAKDFLSEWALKRICEVIPESRIVCVTGMFAIDDSIGAKKELGASHGINEGTGESICLPCEHPSKLGAKFDGDSGEWFIEKKTPIIARADQIVDINAGIAGIAGDPS